MRNSLKWVMALSVLLCSGSVLSAQVYTPKVLAKDQIDTTDLTSLAQGIYKNAHAVTEREKAEAIWRFYLTDGRFVKPGMFYHIPGWSHEEPMGEVLDPIKLINSYGFGLCYQDGPLLEATWEAGGFKSRVWFLTGHTVAEVFYDGQYHLYDSDELGYTTIGDKPFKESTVASVQQLAADGRIITSKMKGPHEVKPGAVDYPWYNADVRDGDMRELAELYTTANDNYLYAYTRYPNGHTMDFVLRPGERMIRYYKLPDRKIFYLPYKTDGKHWEEYPQDYGGSLLVNSGPHSEKDYRMWSTGVIEYRPSFDAALAPQKANQAVFTMSSPYVIIGAKFTMKVTLESPAQKLDVETSTDAGHTWTTSASLKGPFSASAEIGPKTIADSPHGTLNAVAGTYGYWVRLTLSGTSDELKKYVTNLKLATIFEFNPRTLPPVKPGTNVLNYEASDIIRSELPIHASDAQLFASKYSNVFYSSESGQGYLQNAADQVGEMIFKLSADSAGELQGFDTGGRFLDLTGGLAPDKETAETRKIKPWPADPKAPQSASIAWSLKPDGPWTTLWSYDPKINWPDGKPVKHVLRWPEIDRSVRDIQAGTGSVYVRYLFQNLAVDDVRLATIMKPPPSRSKITITHRWLVEGERGEFSEELDGSAPKSYQFDVPSGTTYENEAIIISAH